MRTKVFLFCGIVLAIGVLLLLHRTTNQQKTESAEAQTPATNQPVVSPPAQYAKVATVPNPTPEPSSNIIGETVHRENPDGSNEMNQRLLARWQGRIDFYGKVIDENTNPVAGATVSFHWVEAPTADGNRSATTVSDLGGLFELHDQVGLDLGVSVGKADYYASRRDNDTFNYGPLRGKSFSPDPLNPIIFHLLKKGRPEPLMRLAGAMIGPRQYRLDAKGTPTDIFFYTGKRTSQGEGQFCVAYWMETPQNPNGWHFAWRCRFLC